MVKKIGVFITIIGLFLVGIPQFNSKAQTANIVNFNVGITGTPNEQKYNELLTLYNDGFDRLNFIEIDGTNATSEFSSAQITIYQIYDADNFKYVNEIIIRQSNTTILRVSEINYIFYSDLANNQVQITLARSDRFQEGFEFGRDEYGVNSGGIWYSAIEWANIITEDVENYYQGRLDTEYDRAVSEYGIFIDGQWLTAEEYGQIQYDNGINETDATGFGGLLSAVFGGLGTLLSIEILPNIHIGAIIAVPLVFGIIFFILGKRKGN